MPHRPTTPNLFAEAPAPKSQQKAWINAHCDGGARGNPGPAGFGALIQDDQGIVLAELSEILGIRTNNYAKADTMPRGFPKDGVIHILGNATLPDGVFVKIIRE